MVGWLYIVGVLWGTAFCVTIAGHSGEPPCGLTFLLQLSLVCHISGKDLPPSPSSTRSGCNHYGAPAVQKPVPQSKIHFSSALVPTECITCGGYLGVFFLTWSEAVHWVYWLWSLPGGADKAWALPVFCPGPLGMNYKEICRWLLLVLDLEVPKRCQAANQRCLPLLPGLQPLSKRHRGCGVH